eukprot:15466992-Alexandrium_andersonii.AAC.1
MALVRRPALSVFCEVHSFLRTAGRGSWVPRPAGVRNELLATARPGRFLVSRLGAPWYDRLQMADASPWGGALVDAAADADELREE